MKLSTLVISKLVDAITVAVVDAEKHANDSLVQIWKLKFVNFCSDSEHMVGLRI